MERRRHAVLVCLVGLVLAAAVAVGLDVHAWQQRSHQAAHTFQKAVGGLGMGAIATPIWQFINYDPRIMSVDDSITWPIPGGYSFGPDRTGTVSSFHETPEEQWITRGP